MTAIQDSLKKLSPVGHVIEYWEFVTRDDAA